MRNLILLICLLCLSGCYQFQEKTLSPEQALDDFNQRTLQECRKDSSSTLPKWGLDELTLAAFHYNSELKVACAQMFEIEGTVTTAAELPNPVFGAKPAFNSSTPSNAGISPWILDFVIDFPIETMGKRAIRTATANFQFEAARLRVASIAWSIRNNVRTDLLKIYAIDEKFSIIEHRRQLLKSETEQFRGRLEAGDISAIELQNISMTLDATRIELLEQDRLKREALMHLAQTICVPVEALNGIQFDFTSFDAPPAPVPVPDSRRNALLNRADLLEALAEYNAAQMALKTEILKQYPDLQLSPGYSFDQKEDKWSLGVSFTLPIFNRNQGAIKSAEAKRTAAAAAFLQRQELIASEIEMAVENCNAYSSQLRNLLKIKDYKGQLLVTTEIMVLNGEASGLENILASLQCNQTQADLLQTKINFLEALGCLENAMQHPSDQECCPMSESHWLKGENK